MVEFRKDIQSLRGFSMLLVFLYHYNKKILPTGFIGVDIFFYISGYVNILSYMSKNDKSKVLFYFNRLKRLFPVCHLVLFISILLVRKMNILYQNKQYIDIIYSLLSISNYRFIFLSVDYLSQSEASSVVLHFWSLAVEDQFYLLFPFCISRLYNNTILLILIIIISFIYSCYMNYKSHYISYFSILSRFWQLLFGIISTKAIEIYNYTINNNLLLTIIFIFCFIIKKELYFPSPLSLFPLIMIYLIMSNNKNSYVLERQSLVILGNISYSFYLLHYLIICYFKDKKKNILSCLTILVIILIMSYIVNMLYENPIRKTNNRINILIMYIISFSSISVVCILLINTNTKYMKNKYKLADNNTSIINNCDKYCHIKSNKMIYSPNDLKKEYKNVRYLYSFCPLGYNNYMSKINTFPIVLLLTDSHGAQWFNTIIPYSRKMNYIVIYVWFWEDVIYNKKFYNLKILLNIIPKVQYIVSSHYLHGKNDYNIFKNSYFSYLEILLNHCDIIYVIHDTPHFELDPNLCLLSTSNYENCFAYLGKNATALEFPIYSSDRVHYVDMIPYLCLNSYKCYFIWNSIPIYFDNNHLSLQFTKTLSIKLLKYINFETQRIKINVNLSKPFICSYLTMKRL